MSYSPELRERFRQAAMKRLANPVVDPTLEQIAERCAEIQAGWSVREERSRRPMANRWTLDELRCVDFCVS